MPYYIEASNPVLVSALRMKIESKITNIKSSEAVFNMENNISNGMFELAKNIINNNPDIDKMKKIIDEELEERLKSSPKTVFALNEKQHRAQIYYQLGKIFEIHGKKYEIQNPEKVIDTLQELFGMGLESNIRLVIHNYIERKQYQEAKTICEKYIKLAGENQSILKSMKRIKSDIQMAEIGDIILKGMMAQATEGEQAKFYVVIEQNLKSSKSTMVFIPLGRSQDGRRKITLADIWDNKKDYPDHREL